MSNIDQTLHEFKQNIIYIMISLFVPCNAMMYQSKPKIWSLHYSAVAQNLDDYVQHQEGASVPDTKVGGEPINSAFIFNYSFYRGTFMLTTPELMDPWRINLCQISSIERQLGHFCGKSKKINFKEKTMLSSFPAFKLTIYELPKVVQRVHKFKASMLCKLGWQSKAPFLRCPSFLYPVPYMYICRYANHGGALF